MLTHESSMLASSLHRINATTPSSLSSSDIITPAVSGCNKSLMSSDIFDDKVSSDSEDEGLGQQKEKVIKKVVSKTSPQAAAGKSIEQLKGNEVLNLLRKDPRLVEIEIAEREYNLKRRKLEDEAQDEERKRQRIKEDQMTNMLQNLTEIIKAHNKEK